MHCVFRTNPCKGLQDDYVLHHLSEVRWEVEPNSGNTLHLSDVVNIPRAFSTIRTGSSFLVLMRNKGKLSLCVDAPTLREEVGQHRRPIKDMLYLQAENPADESALCGFAERCLSVGDAEGLGNPRSEVGAAVDEIWATASLQTFMAKFGNIRLEPMSESVGGESWVYPRQDLTARCALARKVRAAVVSQKPFLMALTDRTPSEALSELRSFTGPSVVFSSRIASAQKVVSSDFPQSPFPFNRTGAKIAVVAAIVVSILAIMQSCFGPSHESPQVTVETQKTQSCTNLSLKAWKSCETNIVESQKVQTCTNLPPKAVKSCETNSAACLSDSAITGKNK